MTEDRIARAREALEPFARLKGLSNWDEGIDAAQCNVYHYAGGFQEFLGTLKVSDFRRAAEALALPDDVSEEAAEITRLRDALRPILNYPGTREHIGNIPYDSARTALEEAKSSLGILPGHDNAR